MSILFFALIIAFFMELNELARTYKRAQAHHTPLMHTVYHLRGSFALIIAFFCGALFVALLMRVK